MAKIAHIDENNFLLGFYDDTIHTKIPEPNVTLTEEQWSNAVDNNCNYIANDGSSKYVAKEETSQEKIIGAEVFLNETDWYIIREADTGKPCPEEIKTKREEARQIISDLS
tara:strand:+ start:966 stop:1298 length:333 start_codon:yes stop_codon:yes gene_type:complete